MGAWRLCVSGPICLPAAGPLLDIDPGDAGIVPGMAMVGDFSAHRLGQRLGQTLAPFALDALDGKGDVAIRVDVYQYLMVF